MKKKVHLFPVASPSISSKVDMSRFVSLLLSPLVWESELARMFGRGVKLISGVTSNLALNILLLAI